MTHAITQHTADNLLDLRKDLHNEDHKRKNNPSRENSIWFKLKVY